MEAMITPRASSRRLLAACFLTMAAVGSLLAQSALVVEYKGKPYPVTRVARSFAYIEVDGKEVAAKPTRIQLTPQPEFRPLFVSVRNLEVRTSVLKEMYSGNEMNNEFHFNATFESSFHMKNPFLVLELEMEAGKRIFFQEIGALSPGRPQWVRVTVALPERIGPGKFKLHIFDDGFEVFHSEQPWQFREGVLNKMVMKRINGVKDSPPKPFVGPVPEYPKSLRKAGVKGEAIVAMHITRQGVVVDPAIDRATDPAFGEAALVAVRQWRFLPQVKGGRPIETSVTLPIGFDPPDLDEKP